MELVKMIVAMVKEIKDKKKLWVIYDFIKKLKIAGKALDIIPASFHLQQV